MLFADHIYHVQAPQLAGPQSIHKTEQYKICTQPCCTSAARPHSHQNCSEEVQSSDVGAKQINVN